MLHRVLVREGKEDLLSEDGQEKNPGQPFLSKPSVLISVSASILSC